MIDPQEFRSAIGSLRWLDRDQMEAAGVLVEGSKADWKMFADDTTKFVLMLGTDQLERLVALIGPAKKEE